MVSTRHHPSDFPPPAIPSPSSPKQSTPSRSSGGSSFAHTPSKVILLWLLASIPFVLWDTGYIMLRPHSMPGGWLHSPIWTPYALYGTIDYVYGWPAFNARNGFTAAQGFMNLIETACYLFYLWVAYRHGETASSGGRKQEAKKSIVERLTQDRVVGGRLGAFSLLVVFSAMTMTLSKTLLYCENHAVGFCTYDTKAIQGSTSSSPGLAILDITTLRTSSRSGLFQSMAPFLIYSSAYRSSEIYLGQYA